MTVLVFILNFHANCNFVFVIIVSQSELDYRETIQFLVALPSDDVGRDQTTTD